MTNTYTAENIKEIIEINRESLFASYAVGRPDNWSCDSRTKDLVCIATWLSIELTAIGLSDTDRRTQQCKFNRESRGNIDLFECAANIMNESLAGNVEQNRIPHHRWG
jgi:hypothetical protein